MRQDLLTLIVPGLFGLLGVALGASLTGLKEWCQRKKRQRAYWSALSAEVDLCGGLAEAFVRDKVKAPLYRLPTIAYDTGFPALLGDGVVFFRRRLGPSCVSTLRSCRSIVDWSTRTRPLSATIRPRWTRSLSASCSRPRT